MPVTITSPVLPLFDQIASICQYSVPPELPATSINGITGTWSPENIVAEMVGTSVYTFSPANNECAAGVPMSITIDAPTSPLFTPIAPVCQNSAAPALPTTSTNGISGTWAPSKINVTIPKTNIYKFTPNTSQCASGKSIQVTVFNRITPTFVDIGPVCQNTLPPELPLQSIEGITVKWDPPVISSAKLGSTSYMFTPSEGCAWTDQKVVNVISRITPDFTPIGPLCQNSEPPLLQANSINSISGTWIPSTINTSATGKSTYLFTPADNECANPFTLEILTDSSITPAFENIDPICQFDSPPNLPLTSTNGITGIWNPTLIDTSLPGATSYTFTPAKEAQCANIKTINISINTKVIPIFSSIGPLCQNGVAPVLSVRSTNGISGTWSPDAIDTKIAGTKTYKFTPETGSCATDKTIEVSIVPKISPTFATIGPLCQNSAAPALPLTSGNGIKGSWSPNTINTDNEGNFTYTFTPGADQCAIPITREIVINPPTISLTEQTICISQLPISWNSLIINTSGTYNAKLAGSKGCDSIATLNLKVQSETIPTFDQIGPLIYGSIAPQLRLSSTNGITGIWNPSAIVTGSAGTISYSFIPDPNQCATTARMDIQVDIQAVISEKGIIPDPTGIQAGSCEIIKLDGSKSVGDSLQYQWSSPDRGCVLSQSTGINTELSLSGDYQGSLPADFRVQLQITDRNRISKSDWLIVHIDPPPVANVYSSGTIEKDGSMIIDGSVSTGIAISYKWSTNEGKVVGEDDKPTASFFGAGMYQLRIVDIHGCQSIKDFKFPIEIYTITALPDNYRITWSKDTILHVLDNDVSNAGYGTVRVIKSPNFGMVTVNSDHSITYMPTIRKPGNDQFEYEVCNPISLCDSAFVTIEIFDSSLSIPEGFSPNGDGVNDNLIFKGLDNYKTSKIYIYTRSGQLVYSSGDYQNNWDGRTGGALGNRQPVPTGTYYYVLKLGQTNRSVKGFIYIGY